MHRDNNLSGGCRRENRPNIYNRPFLPVPNQENHAQEQWDNYFGQIKMT